MWEQAIIRSKELLEMYENQIFHYEALSDLLVSGSMLVLVLLIALRPHSHLSIFLFVFLLLTMQNPIFFQQSLFALVRTVALCPAFKKVEGVCIHVKKSKPFSIDGVYGHRPRQYNIILCVILYVH